ncbi:MAG: hypothetical protein HOQ13_09220, partial [Dermatophilaceae bacterium]|nr:hypothetical protein [Dermatophilaceae bacterium]
MPSASFGGGAVRVRVPRGYDVFAAGAPDRADRDLPGPDRRAAERAALVEALGSSDFVVVDRIDLAPRRGRDLGAAQPPNRRGTVHVDVDVPAGDDAVVLLEHDGVYSWHLPVPGDRSRSRSLGAGPRTVSFELPVQRLAATRPTERPRPDADASHGADRGLLGDLVHGAMQAVVLRFAVPAVLEKVVDHLESNVRTGLVHVTGGPLDAWKPVGSIGEVGLPTDHPVRVLLLVHGTFSSTVGAFGALAVTPGAEGFVDTLVAAYDAVLGFDHRTLSVDPERNARELLDLLEPFGGELVIDVITHSRGGLVTRSFVESVLPASGLRATVGSVVLVAATNAGTHLADPERWHDLVDLYTNLVLVTAGGLALVPGGAAFGAIVGGVVRGVGALVKYLASCAAGDDGVPGLAAMRPGGAFVTALDAVRPARRENEASWYVVTSDFHVSLFDDHHNPPEFPRELAVRLAEGFVDGLFEGRNDLVVDTDSMSTVGGSGLRVSGTCALGTNDVVHHVNYFAQLRVIGQISQWLPLGLGASDDESHLPLWMTAALPLDDRGLGAAPDEPEPVGAEAEAPPSMATPPPAPPPPAPAAPSPTPPPTPIPAPPPAVAQDTPAELAAEMPSTVTPGADFTVRVRLSRQAMTATPGSVHADETVHVDASQAVSVQVYAKANALVQETEPKLFALSSVDGIAAELTFRVRPLAVGPVRVMIVLRQGTVIVATLTLEASAEGATLLGPQPVTAIVHTGVSAPELQGVPCLDIVEGRRVTGERVYSYALRLAPGEPAQVFESAPIVSTRDFVQQRIAEVERVVKDPDLT